MSRFRCWSFSGPLPQGSAVERWDGAGSGLEMERLRPGAAGAAELLRRLREARPALVARPARELARVLGAVGERFRDPADPLRQEALELLPPTAALSPPMAREVLDGMAADWTPARLRRLLDLELDGGAPLDGFVDSGAGRRSRALGAPLALHLCAGTVPGVSVTSMVRALLVKSAVLLKPGRGDEVLPVLFHRGLGEADPALAGAAAVLYWPGAGDDALPELALSEADLVVVYGGDEAVRAARVGARATTPVVVYPHRVSLGVVAPPPAGDALAALAAQAARSVALFEQRGCVSPHLFYVLGEWPAAEAFAAALAGAMARLGETLPAGPPEPAAAAAQHQLRGTAELLAAEGPTRVWSGGANLWTVVLDPSPGFEASCLGRAVRVKCLPSVAALVEALAPVRRHLQTVGVGGLGEREAAELGERLAGFGGVRLAPLARAPWPPPWWHHDGAGPLAPLLRWTDLEGPGD